MTGRLCTEGRAWVLGNAVDTDALAPSALLRADAATMAAHCLETLRPEFAAGVRPGDVLVAGERFGVGSSREQAAESLLHLGVGCVLARSFARIFYRNALNLGLPVLVCPDTVVLGEGEHLRVDALAGAVHRLDRGGTVACEPLPPHLVAMLRDGGLLPHLKRRLGAGSAGARPGTA